MILWFYDSVIILKKRPLSQNGSKMVFEEVFLIL